MPLYEYTCQSCGKPFERLVLSSAAEDKVTCPHCASKDVNKSISGSSYRSTFPGKAAPPACGPNSRFR